MAEKAFEANHNRNGKAKGYKPLTIPVALRLIRNDQIEEPRKDENHMVSSNIQIVSESFKAIGTFNTCKKNEKETEMPLAINAFKSRLEEISHRTGNGLLVFGPEPIENGVMPWKVAAEVTSIDHVPDGMRVIEFSEMQYACYNYSGSKSQIGEAYSALHVWILENGNYGNGAMIEKWDIQIPFEDEHSDVLIYVPFVWEKEASSTDN